MLIGSLRSGSLKAAGHAGLNFVYQAGLVSNQMHLSFQSSDVATVFDAYPESVKAKLLQLRQLIFDTAGKTTGVGELEETLKWGQPSYLTPVSKSGLTIRIDRVKNGTANYAMYFHCQTSLVDSFRLMFGDTFKYEGNRAILFDEADEIPVEALRQCISIALTYHLKKE